MCRLQVIRGRAMTELVVARFLLMSLSVTKSKLLRMTELVVLQCVKLTKVNPSAVGTDDA
jgi:hypothetical protein